MNLAHIMNKAINLKHLGTILLLLLLALPMSAQESADSVFTFRFHVGKNEFYSPGLNNGKELARMYALVDRCKNQIKKRQLYLYVDGYSSSKRDYASNLEIAKIRSNRVKSELITNKGLKEYNFVTHNHVGRGNFVTVRFRVPKSILKDHEKQYKETPPICPEQEPLIVKDEEDNGYTPKEPVDSLRVEDKTPENPEVYKPSEDALKQSAPADTVMPDIGPAKVKKDSDFALKTNLLGYAVLMPNVEVEWKFRKRWSAALEGQIAWYGRENPHKAYRLATVTPEVRFWPIERAKWHGMYVGVFGGLGLYDLSKGHNGHQGEGFMVGASAGYMWPISKHLSLDAGLGVGYLRARDKVYSPFEGHFLYQLTKHINYFGPLRLKLSLVWRIPK